jgi:hypothetical protein
MNTFTLITPAYKQNVLARYPLLSFFVLFKEHLKSFNFPFYLYQ